ncbi:HBL/NHE enterotoxin family protein [Bacillus toyonensis]|uniref:Hemolysin BL lytic component L1 n=1 Tax=Bacillus toyonensis TaxID=155322 RepID=A0A2C4PSH3_9BACI|nr:HBL/NHE enterotoxin family protein [Bacillus toyonensis]PGB02015.1 hemolysin BL lytic component L1 [Bacillus toyonensis]PHD67975.1 hemolysin BL lytic component L1 [Bacillus toyonensis]
MKNSPYKILSTAAMIAAITAGNIIPSTHVFAQEKVVQEQQESSYKLGPDGMKEALAKTGSHMLVMNIYASTMIKQPIIDLSKINLGVDGKDLVKNIKDDQNMSIVNANYWLNQAKPQIQKTARNIITYNTQFQNYYDTIVGAAKKNDKSTVTEGLQDLYTTINTNSKEVDGVIRNLKDFKEKLVIDSNQFKNDVDGANGKPGVATILAATSPQIKDLENQIASLRSDQKASLDNALGWGIGGGLGTFLLIGGAIGGIIVIVATGGAATPLIVGGLAALTAAGIGLGTATGIELSQNITNYNKISDTIAQLGEQRDAAKQAVTVLSNAKATLTDLSETVDKAIDSLTALKKQWDTMGANYKVLLDSVDSMQPAKVSLLVNDLDAAKQQWSDIYQAADLVSKDIGFKNK